MHFLKLTESQAMKFLHHRNVFFEPVQSCTSTKIYRNSNFGKYSSTVHLLMIKDKVLGYTGLSHDDNGNYYGNPSYVPAEFRRKGYFKVLMDYRINLLPPKSRFYAVIANPKIIPYLVQRGYYRVSDEESKQIGIDRTKIPEDEMHLMNLYRYDT